MIADAVPKKIFEFFFWALKASSAKIVKPISMSIKIDGNRIVISKSVILIFESFNWPENSSESTWAKIIAINIEEKMENLPNEIL